MNHKVIDQSKLAESKISGGMLRWTGMLALCGTVLLGTLRRAYAATYNVTNVNDSGTGSLRAALLNAGAGDTINVAPAAGNKITLSSGELQVTKALTIVAPTPITIDANNAGRAINVMATSPSVVTISGLTITGGAPASSYNGGGVFQSGNCSLYLKNCTITGNKVTNGSGGGVCGYYRALLDVEYCTISNNTVTGSTTNGGGGIFGYRSNIVVKNSTISGNTVSGCGGGIYGFDAKTVVINSTISGNTANIVGGGAFLKYHYVSGGDIVPPPALAAQGRGAYANNLIQNCTISNNNAGVSPPQTTQNYGGGLYLFSNRLTSAGATTLSSNIIAGNFVGSTPKLADDVYASPMAQPYTLADHNLVGIGISGIAKGNNLFGTPSAPLNALLGTLANNGGPTQTMALLSGSPAIDAGATNGLTVDQRGTGFPRVNNGTADIGALESPPPPVIASAPTVSGLLVAFSPLTFTAAATDPLGLALTYNWDFGDGSVGSGASVQHTYSAGGTFTVNLVVSNGTASASTQISVTLLDPAVHGQPNIGMGQPPIVNPESNFSISEIYSDGGVIQLLIDATQLRAAVNVNTEMDGIGTRSSPVSGTTPVFKLTDPGAFVALATATDPVTGALLAKGRKTILIGGAEVGQPPKITAPPKSQVFKKTKLKGKLSFSSATKDVLTPLAGAGTDTVTMTTSIELPAGFDLSAKHEFDIAIGNILDVITVDSKGKGAVPGTGKVIKKLQVKYPKLKKGQTTLPAGQTATITVTMSGSNFSANGFDTEGISAQLTPQEKAAKSVQRSIQVGMVIGGIPYEVQAPVDFKVTKTGGSGSFGTRN